MSKQPGYIFTKGIESQLKGFKTHLQELGQNKNTIRPKANYTGYFLTWLESEGFDVQTQGFASQVRYNDLLNFIDYCKLESNSNKLINGKLRAIRNFYGYLKEQSRKLSGPTIANPATNLYLKGIPKKTISGIISFTELETLYQSYPAETTRTKRNKAILGLLIYQGITTEELAQLETGHLKLKEGKIYVPGNRRRNGRNLELKPFQIMELYEYQTRTRPTIIAEITKPKPTRKPDQINHKQIENQLFISINGSEHIKNSLLHLFRDIKKINPNITSAKQIRQSTITHWLKNYNLREVQYMAGHKHVSSTERYQANNLESLQTRLEKYHPLSGTKNEY